ncbi:ghrelin/obestatin prepropeptide isoform X1 [Thunnus thynnus]|uniref:ghrelin/obestatin prepropeptide isoform X1 n=1 Tax=Thunnus thynnus TaxID=8237 RepID=UPI003527F206
MKTKNFHLSFSYTSRTEGNHPESAAKSWRSPVNPLRTTTSQLVISAPFEIGITMSEEDFEEYGDMMQEVIQRLLGNTKTAERSSQL